MDDSSSGLDPCTMMWTMPGGLPSEGAPQRILPDLECTVFGMMFSLRWEI